MEQVSKDTFHRAVEEGRVYQLLLTKDPPFFNRNQLLERFQLVRRTVGLDVRYPSTADASNPDEIGLAEIPRHFPPVWVQVQQSVMREIIATITRQPDTHIAPLEALFNAPRFRFKEIQDWIKEAFLEAALAELLKEDE